MAISKEIQKSSEMKFDGKLIKVTYDIADVNGTKIYYTHYINKTVPADYELTEEDKAAEASGKLVFSCGSSKVEVLKVQSVTWKKDGIQYQLLQLDGKLSADELVDMAGEVIEK